MKRTIVLAFLLATTLLTTTAPAFAEETCKVEVCNRLKRFSLNPVSHIKDKFGEACYFVQMPKSEAIVGKELASNSRWYQGSFNPTKRSVTYIKEVGVCR